MEEASDPYASIRANPNTGLDNQKAALDMLQAVESTLAERSLPRTAENYFKALWPLLEKTEQVVGLEGMQASIVYLVAFVMPSLPTAFIREEAYSEIFARLPGLIKEGHGNGPLMRSAIASTRAVLLAFPVEAWPERSSLLELFALIMGLCLDERPKVRKLAQDAVVALLVSEGASAPHPALSHGIQLAKMVLQGSTRKESCRALHLAPLLGRLVPGLDQGAIDGLLGPVLQCTGLGNGHLTVALLGFLEGLCRTVDDEGKALLRLTQLNLTQARKVLEGLVRHCPGSFELGEIASAWIGAYGACLAHPVFEPEGRLEAEPHLGRLFEALQATQQEPVLVACQLAFSRLSLGLTQNVLPPMLLGALERSKAADGPGVAYLLAIIRDQVMLLSGRSALAAAQAVREGNRPAGLPVMSPTYQRILGLMADLHDRKGFGGLRNDLVRALHDFIRVFGPEVVLQVVPLGLEPRAGDATTPSRAWLLPILKEATYNASLGFFCRELGPLAERLQVRAKAYHTQGKPGDAKVYETVVYQLWSLVPSFLRYPTDLDGATIGVLAPRLATLINEDPVLRPQLVNALATFVEQTRALANDLDGTIVGGEPLLCPITPTQAEAQLAALAALAGNFLPLLFNLLGVTKADQRQYLLRAVRAFLEISPGSLVEQCFGRVSAHVPEAADAEQKACLLELLCTMAPFLGLEAHRRLLEAALPIIREGTEAGLQKAAYKALHQIAGHEMYGAELTGDAAAMEAVEAALMAGGPLIDVSAVRKCRFRCLLALVPQLEDGQLHWIPLVLPEVILGTKEVNQKTRLLAFELLLAMARRMVRGGLIPAARTNGMLVEDTPASLEEFLTMVLAGLAGRTPHMISATVLALARLLFDLSGTLAPGTIQAILGDILVLLGSPSREIVKAAFGYIKVAVVTLPVEALQPHLGDLLRSVLVWSGEHAMHFKVRVRHLMERLLRRFGYEAVLAGTPEEHRKLLQNIRKRKERAKRQKKAAAEATAAALDDEDGEQLDMDRLTTAALSRHQTSMITRRGISSTAQATRPSARFEAALYDSESDLGSSDDDADGLSEEEAPLEMIDELDLETALTRKLSLRSRALTKATAMVNTKHAAAKQTRRPTSAADFKTNPEGKMIIEDSEEEDLPEDLDDGVVLDENAHRLYEQSLRTFSRPGKHVKFSQKRSRDDDDEEDADGYQPTSAASRLSRLSRPITTVGSRPAAHSGAEYRAKRGAGGDCKSKKARLEPYAYLPLQRSTKQRGGAGKAAKPDYFLKKGQRRKPNTK